MQIATGYAAFANGGYRIQPYFIQKVEDHDGKVLFEADPARVCSICQIQMGTPPRATGVALTTSTDGSKAITLPSTSLIQAVNAAPDGSALPATTETPAEPPAPFHQADRIMKASAAYDMANILRDVIQHGTGRAALKLGRSDIGGKTGTTNDAKDAWFSGFQPNLVAVTWVGFDQPSTLGRREFGGIAALPIWSSFMEKALDQQPEAWVTRTGQTEKTTLKTDDIAKQAARDRALMLAERRAKAPPMGIVIQRPRPVVVPAKPSSIDPQLPVTRIAPNTTHSGSYSAPKPAGSVAPDQIF
jgi:penicillin-binding protein 1A